MQPIGLTSKEAQTMYSHACLRYNNSLILCILVHSLFFNYSLGNIFPVYHSTIKAIQILAITKLSVLMKYGSDVILYNFMENIKKLESVSYLLGLT